MMGGSFLEELGLTVRKGGLSLLSPMLLLILTLLNRYRFAFSYYFQLLYSEIKLLLAIKMWFIID